MRCWKCGAEEKDPAWGKLPFRAACEKCGADLHCCRNCIYYKPGMPNDCLVPNTEYIADRTANNLCEEFKLSGQGPKATSDASEASKRLFGDDASPKEKDPKKRFDSLFGD